MSETDDTSWISALPEPLREAPYLAKADSPEKALEALNHAAQFQGNALRIPGEDAGDDQRQKFYDTVLEKVPDLVRISGEPDDAQLATILSKLGAPAEADKYALPDVEEWEWDDDYADQLKGFAQAAGMTQRQFNTFADKLATSARDNNLTANAAIEEARTALYKEWGQATDERKALIRGWMDKTEAPEELRELFEDGNMDASTMKWLHTVASSFKDTVKPLDKDDKTRDEAITPGEATEKINEILNNPAYFDTADPLNKVLRERMLKYQNARAAEEDKVA